MANSAFDHTAAITVPGSSTNTALVRWSGTGADTFTDSTILVGATTMGLAADTDLLTFGNGTIAITGAVTGVTALTASGAVTGGTLVGTVTTATQNSITTMTGLATVTASGVVTGGTLAGTVSTATQNSITTMTGLTTVGTVGTGVWNGTAIVQAYIGAEAINESKMQVSNAPTNGYVLTARDGVTGGFTWEAAASGGVDTTGTPANNQIAIFTDADTVEGTANLTSPYTGQLKLLNAGGSALFYLDGSNGGADIRYNNAGTTKWTSGIDADGSSNQKSHVDDYAFYNNTGSGVYRVVIQHSTGSIGTQGGLALSGSTIQPGGIQFPATPVANASPNNLDDYEEGTWSPRIADDNLSGLNNGTQSGFYTKVGNVVTVTIDCRPANITGLAGGNSIRIVGLPFTSNNTNVQALSCARGSGLAITAGTNLVPGIAANTTNMKLYLWDAADGTNELTVTQFSSDGSLIIAGSYLAQ